MSKAQGDNFRTHTDHNLNAYRARLDLKLHDLIAEKETCYVIKNNSGEELLVYCVQGNEIANPNGGWKWNGWRVTGRYYRLSLYKAGTYSFDNDYARNNNTVLITGLPLFHYVGNDRDLANQMYKEYIEMAKDYTVAELLDMSEIWR